MLRQTCRHLGFTLAEVLITLGIIGVVAAMTIPTLLTNIRNKELQAQLKKTYSEWNQVSMQFMDDNDTSIPDFVANEYIEKGNAKDFTAELPKYIKGVTKYSDWNWTIKDNDGNSNSVNAQPYKTYTLKGSAKTLPCDSSVYGGLNFDIGGKFFSFDDPPKYGYNGPRLCVDLNGKDKPNTFGIDIFSFIFTTDGHIIPEGQPHKDNNYSSGWGVAGGTYSVEDNKDHCSTERITCTYYAIHDISPTGHGTYWKDYIGKKQYK